VSPAKKEASVTTVGHVRADIGPEERELARPAPAPKASNSALTHLYAAISDLEKEVEMDKRDLVRLEALHRGIGKKQELLAALIKERGKFVGQE
jgi:hypothetical protein